MGDIFYFLGLIVTLLNIFLISKFKRTFELKEWMVKFKAITGRNPVSNDYRKADDRDILNTWSVSVIATSMWIFFGLLTNSWYVFLFIMLINTSINIIGKYFGEFSKVTFVISFVKNLITLFVVGFLTINHFHLHLDIWSTFMTILSQTQS